MNRRHKFLAGGLFASLLVAPCAYLAQESHPPHWTYEHPEQWGKLDPAYSVCSRGSNQSPIDLGNSEAADLPALRIDYKAVPLQITDNGHTIQVDYSLGSTLTAGDHVYTLRQFHFHHPAEERISGKSFPLDAHLVHTDAEGHIAVVAVLFELGDRNPLIDSMWKNIPTEKEKPTKVASVVVQAEKLLPRERDYSTFSGSLTTPPCTEGVTWYVLQKHMTISSGQLDAFAKLYPENARPIQPSNGRHVLRSK
jgi:carbonic anhydrase